MASILVVEHIHEEGIRLLERNVDVVDVKTDLQIAELMAILGEYQALIVRSGTRVTEQLIEAGQHLVVIGRAGVGVDNIDLEAATRRGIAVVTAPTGNTLAAAEHALALLLSMARNIPQAHASMLRGEWKRSQFMGTQVRNKILGIVGLGKVGSEVARRAGGLGLRVIAHDPFVSPEHAQRLDLQLVSLEELLRESDFVTLHMPLTEATRHLIGEQRLNQMKPTVRLINTARGELIDMNALLHALRDDRIAGVALDVFEKEPPNHSPLVEDHRVILTPHLGASTVEAQQEVAIEVAEQVIAVLEGRPAYSTVNIPFVSPEVHAVVDPYLAVGSLLGRLLPQMMDGQFLSLHLRHEGEIAGYDTALLRSAVVMGLLNPVSEERVNLINAQVIASQHGLKISEEKRPTSDQYSSLLTATLHTDTGSFSISGTYTRDQTHIVRLNDYWIDMLPSSLYLLFIEHQDRPGLIGAVGTITGTNDINISFMEVGREAPRGRAMMVLGLDESLPPEVLQKIRELPHIYTVRLARV